MTRYSITIRSTIFGLSSFSAARERHPPTHALLQKFPDIALKLVAACPNLYQDDAPPVASRVSETTIIDHAHRNPTRCSHLSLRGTNYTSRSSRPRGRDANCPTLALHNTGGSQSGMEGLTRALGPLLAFLGNTRAGSDANAGGGVRMLGPLQRASTLPALGYGGDSQNSTGRDTDCESPPLTIGGLPALADGDVQRHDPNPEALLTRLRLTRVVHRPRMWHAVSVTLRLPSLTHRRQHIGRPRRHCAMYMLLLRQPRLLLHLRRQRPKSMI